MIALLPFIAASASMVQPTVPDQAALYWQQGEFTRATEIWSAPERAADPDALYNLGQAYRLGKGVARDPAQAIAYYRRADRAGHPKASEQLGLMLFGDDATRAEALDLLERAARQGAPRASYVMGLEHLDGRHVRRDVETARAYLERAAAAGVPGASPALASLAPQNRAASTAITATTAKASSIPASRSPSGHLLQSVHVRDAGGVMASTQLQNSGEAQAVFGPWLIVLGQYQSMTSAAVKWLKISARANLRNQNAMFQQVTGGVKLSLVAFDQARALKLCADLSAQKVACTVESREQIP